MSLVGGGLTKGSKSASVFRLRLPRPGTRRSWHSRATPNYLNPMSLCVLAFLCADFPRSPPPVEQAASDPHTTALELQKNSCAQVALNHPMPDVGCASGSAWIGGRVVGIHNGIRLGRGSIAASLLRSAARHTDPRRVPTLEHSFASASPMRSNSFHSHLPFDARSREAHSPISVFRASAAQTRVGEARLNGPEG
jgi:hypothetical protein